MKKCLLMLIVLAAAGCQIEGRSETGVEQVRTTARTGQQTGVIIDIATVFPDEDYCKRYGADIQSFLSAEFSVVQFVECRAQSGLSVGYFRIQSEMVQTNAAPGAAEKILRGNLLRFAVYPDPKEKNLSRVGIVIDDPEIRDIQTRVEQTWKLGPQSILFRYGIRNNGATRAAILVSDAIVDGQATVGERLVWIEPGKIAAIRLSEKKRALLRQRGWVEVFALKD